MSIPIPTNVVNLPVGNDLFESLPQPTLTPVATCQQFINTVYGKHLQHGITGTELKSGAILHKFATDATFYTESQQQKYFGTCSTDGTLSERGNPSRTNKACVACHAIVCDGVSTKAKAPPVEPSWKIETSAGNFQYGFLIEPTDDFDKVDQLVTAIIKAGYSDSGARGFNRIFRVPGSYHSKSGFIATLRAWTGKRWALDDLVADMGVAIATDE